MFWLRKTLQQHSLCPRLHISVQASASLELVANERIGSILKFHRQTPISRDIPTFHFSMSVQYWKHESIEKCTGSALEVAHP